jgi:hypothetical protein
MTADPGHGQSSITYIPLPKDASSPAMALLFMHEAEYFMHTKDLAGNSQVLAVLDDYPIGAGTGFEDDTQSPHTSIWAEEITVAGEFKATNLQVSASQITSRDGAALNVSGAPVEPFPQPADSGNGEPGKPGNRAGTLALYSEILPAGTGSQLALPDLLARGGAGQRGQSAPFGTGGPGGKGGSGGRIAAYLASPYLHAIADMSTLLENLDGLDAINRLAAVLRPFDPTIQLAGGTTLKQAIASILALGAQLFPDKSHPRRPASGEAAITAISGLSDLVFQVSERFGTLTDNMRTKLLGSLHESAGAGGQGGTGATDGDGNAVGPDPVNGSAQLTFRADSAAIDPTATQGDNIDAIVKFIDLTQCQMLLAKAKMSYMQADSVASPQALTDTARLLERLVQRLAFVPAMVGDDGTMPDPRLQPYRTLYLAAASYLANLSQGLDYYGNPANAVPLVNFTILSSMIDSQLEYFQQAERAYSSYFVALQRQIQTRDQIAAAAAGARAAVTQSQQVISDLGARLQNLAGQIAAYDAPIAAKKEVLGLVMGNAVNDINAYYSFTWADGFGLFKDILGALTSVAFMPESWLMGATQGAGAVGDIVNTLGVHATTTIPNDQGVSVNKSYLVNQVVSIEDSAKGLSEGYAQLDNGQLQPDDPGAAKLLMLESQFDKVMSDFKDELPDDIKAVKKAFKDYLGVVVHRNNAIMRYNAYVNVIGNYLAQQQAARQLLDRVHSQSFADQDPGLPSLVSAMATIYHITRDQLMATFYNASRALQFWSLSNNNFLAAALTPGAGDGYSPSSINYGFAQVQLSQAWETGLEAFQTNPSCFPESDGEDGAVIEFSDDATLTTFRAEQAVTLRVPAVRAPGGDDDNVSALDPKWTNSLLVDQCDVRMIDMRVWLDGVKVTHNGTEVDDVLNIRIAHGGYSVLVSPGNQVFRFDHDAVVKTFQYHTIERDPANPGRPKVEMDADFGDLQFGDPTQGVNFTLLSPFAEFTIELENEDAAPTRVGLAQALAGHQVAVGTIVEFGGQRAPVTDVETSGDSTVVTVGLLGVEVQKFAVTDSTVTDRSGAAAEPSVLIPSAGGGRQIDLSGLTAIRLEFTGTSYTFTT